MNDTSNTNQGGLSEAELARLRGQTTTGTTGTQTYDPREPEVDITNIAMIIKTLPSRDFMADMLASMVTANAAPATPALLPSGVSVSLQRSRERFAFPSARDIAARPLEARALLTGALQRGFDRVVAKGHIAYRRQDRPPLANKPAPAGVGGPALRGAGLVQTEMLRAYCALVLQLLDDFHFRDELLRERIRGDLDALVGLVATPLGPTAGQGQGRFRRLILAIADWLEAGRIVAGQDLRRAAAAGTMRDLLTALETPAGYAAAGAVIPTREGDLRVKALYQALHAIGAIVDQPLDADVGVRGAQLEQAMTLLCASGAQLQAELDRLGTSVDEQEIAFFSFKEREVSIAQFADWVQDVCAAFATGDDEAPTLRDEDLAVLEIDLAQLVGLAKALEDHARTYAAELRLIGARRQMKEVGFLLRRALDALRALRASVAA